MKRRSVYLVIAAWLLVTVGLLLHASHTPARAYQVPAPPGEHPQQSSAEWTIQNPAFESNYPQGFTFTIQAASSGGEIERARLIWNKATLRPTETLTIYAIDAKQDAATGELTATWEPSATQDVPPWALLQYHWEFRDAAGNEYKTDPVEVEYEDHTRPWRRSESEDVIVYVSDLPKGVEDMVLDALAQQHDRYLAVWGVALPYRPRIVLFGDFDAWLEWQTQPTPGEGIRVGVTLDEWGVIVQVLYPAQDKQALQQLAYGTVVHETEHLYQLEFMWPTRSLYDTPRWFTEGDATFFELIQDRDYLGDVQQQAVSGELPRLLTPSPADAPGAGGTDRLSAYDIGYSFFVWLQEKSGGLDAHAQLMKLMAEDVPFLDALEQVTGLTVDEIERDWRVWLGASPEPPALIPTWTPVFPVVVTPTSSGK